MRRARRIAWASAAAAAGAALLLFGSGETAHAQSLPILTIADACVLEGPSGTNTTMTFTVTMSEESASDVCPSPI